MKFRKRPIVIEAVQINDAFFDDPHPNPNHPTGAWIDPISRTVDIVTPEGTMTGKMGDWIITGVQGEKYPCKPDIFAATYESVD